MNTKAQLLVHLINASSSDLLAALERLVGSGRIAASQAVLVYRLVNARRRGGL